LFAVYLPPTIGSCHSVPPNDRKISEEQIGLDVEGSGRDLIIGIFPEFARRTEENHSRPHRIASLYFRLRR
jgi:hypothetical protein